MKTTDTKTAADFMQVRELTDKEWMKLPKKEIIQLHKNLQAALDRIISNYPKDSKQAERPSVTDQPLPEQTERKELTDLIQYVTNLLYAAYTGAQTSDEFDKWVEEKTNELSQYYASLLAKQSEPRNEQLTCPHTYHTKSGYCKYCGLYNADKNIR